MSKKKGAVEEKVLLGRPGNNLKCGIVGLPNVGKSQTFNVLCNMTVPSENFPFCTIDPTSARVAVPDERFDWLCKHHKPAKEVPAYLWVTDIAGLVKGAAEGQGLGNAFLSHINAVDGILHMVRAFDDPDVTHVEGSIDPVRDMEIIHSELRQKDIEFVEKYMANVEKNIMKCRNDKAKLKEEQFKMEVVTKALEHLKSGKDVRNYPWTSKDVPVVNDMLLLTAKPVIYLVNLTEKDFLRKKNKFLPKIKQWIDENSSGKIIPYSAIFEENYMHMSDEEKKACCEEHKVVSMIPKIITAAYSELNLIHFFTCGKDEVKCWTVRQHTKAPKAAGTIHTDFEKGFIMAEVMSYDEFREKGSESAMKAAGRVRMEGKTYVVQDGDIMFFKAGQVNDPKKKK